METRQWRFKIDTYHGTVTIFYNTDLYILRAKILWVKRWQTFGFRRM